MIVETSLDVEKWLEEICVPLYVSHQYRNGEDLFEEEDIGSILD